MCVRIVRVAGVFISLCCSMAFAQNADSILISEFQPNPPGTDPEITNVEISGSANTEFNGWILSVESDAGTSAGLVDSSVQVTGTFNADGLLVVSIPDWENPSFTIALTSEFTGTVGTSNINDDENFLGVIYDAIGVPDIAGDEEVLFGTRLGGSDFTYTGREPELIFRDASIGVLYAVNALGVAQVQDINSDSVDIAAFNSNPLAPSFGEINPALDDGDTNSDGDSLAFGVCGDRSETRIHLVQGSDSASPLIDNEVVVEGVVVGAYQSGTNGNTPLGGYFLQEEDSQVDSDNSSSEGIFVSDVSNIVAAGDTIRVKGFVAENFGLTSLNRISEFATCTTNGSVSAASLSLPVENLTDFEAVEGMLVTFDQILYVTDNYTLGRFGEVGLTSDLRLYTPTQIAEPGIPAMSQQMANDLTRIQLDDGLTSQNPVPVPSYFAADGTLRAGDSVSALNGVMSYGFGSYEVQPVETINFSRVNERSPAPELVGGGLRVASFNVLNYFTTLDGMGAICGPDMNLDCRGADSSEEFTRQKDKIVAALSELDADIVGLIEIENDLNSIAIADLVNALPGYSFIDTGPIGTDAIKVALIHKNTVVPIGNYSVLDSSVDPLFIDDKNRPVLIQTFEEVADGAVFTVAVTHLKSKGSDCDDLGDPDLNDYQGNCNLTRTNAARALVDHLATDPTGSGDPDVLIIGDLNAYAMEDPIAAIQSAGYTNLVLQQNGATDYSYSFDGQFGTLDYAMSSDSLSSQVTGVTVWKINADEPAALDYNDFNQPSLYQADPYGSSDHDPVVIELDLTGLEPQGPYCDGLPATIIAHQRGGVLFGTQGDDVIVGSPQRDIILGRGGNDIICSEGGPDLVFGGFGHDRIFGGAGNDLLLGQQGDDFINGEEGNNRLFGGRGDDILIIVSARQTAHGQAQDR